MCRENQNVLILSDYVLYRRDQNNIFQYVKMAVKAQLIQKEGLPSVVLPGVYASFCK